MRKILIIEDEPAIAENATYALRTEGFDPEVAATGEAGLSALAAGDVSLVVLDIGLPDINGFDLFRKIRDTSNAPVIFLTARGEEIDRIAGLEMGGDDYVVKPFSPRELSARVRAVLRRTAATDHPPAKNGAPFAVDEHRRTIAYFGKRLDLSRYEYKMLHALIRRPGWVFTREKLMDEVWDAPDASYDRTVDTHIKTLRAKLREINPDVDPIRTHRGTGYSLRESW